MSVDRPGEIRINAWDGEETPLFDFPEGAEAEPRVALRRSGILAPRYLPKPWDWRSPDVGWGLVLRDDPNLSGKEKAAGIDAPEPIQRLLKARAPAPVLRYKPNKPPGLLYRYYADGAEDALSTAAPDRGIREGQIPQYLLIYGSPSEIPWAVQFGLNASAFVGRLDLSVEEGLGHYVDALISEWRDHDRGDMGKPVVWSADWGIPDITFLVARIVGARLAEKFAGDEDFAKRTWLTKRDATCGALADTLRTQRPVFVCTTSHGMTGPLNDPAATHAHLGSPVDSLRQVVQPQDLGDWEPGGAIWYSHACCSAGSDAVSRYAELIPATQRGGPMLRQLAAVSGARVAPLPRMLLGRPNPLAAFVGHVEPTFDWTLRDPMTKQELSHTIVRCLYQRLFTNEHPAPIGWALEDIFDEAANYFALPPAGSDMDDRVALDVHRKLVAIDRQNVVILGDPTVRLGTGQA